MKSRLDHSNNRSVAETKTIKEILTKIFEDPKYRQELEAYSNVFNKDSSQLLLYLPVEKKSGNFYFKLNENETLKNNLRHKEVIEYPVIHVSLEKMNEIEKSFEDILRNRVKDEIERTIKSLPRSFGKKEEKGYKSKDYKSKDNYQKKDQYQKKEPYPKKVKKE